MKNLKVTLILSQIFIVLIMPDLLLAQTDSTTVKSEPPFLHKKELGMHLKSLDSWSFIYKARHLGNKFWRIKGVVANLSSANNGLINSGQFGISVGKEKRKSLRESLYFVNGWDVLINTTIQVIDVSDPSLVFIPSLGIGKVIGIQYHINDIIYVGIEYFPNASVSLIASEENVNIRGNVGLNLNNVSLLALFKF